MHELNKPRKGTNGDPSTNVDRIASLRRINEEENIEL